MRFYRNVPALACDTTWYHLLSHLQENTAIYTGEFGQDLSPYTVVLLIPITNLDTETYLQTRMRKETEYNDRKAYIEGMIAKEAE